VDEFAGIATVRGDMDMDMRRMHVQGETVFRRMGALKGPRAFR
jgi:hypothetical protein